MWAISKHAIGRDNEWHSENMQKVHFPFPTYWFGLGIIRIQHGWRLQRPTQSEQQIPVGVWTDDHRRDPQPYSTKQNQHVLLQIVVLVVLFLPCCTTGGSRFTHAAESRYAPIDWTPLTNLDTSCNNLLGRSILIFYFLRKSTCNAVLALDTWPT